MKKILLTSTALVAFAGAASAEVTLSGSAEMGFYGSNAEVTLGTTTTKTEEPFQFHTDIDVKFSMSGETDSGLSFGATVDLDEAAGLGNEETNAGFSVFISGDFGTVTMGDTDSAMDWALTEAGNVGNPGSIRDDETSHLGYNGSYNDGLGAYDNQQLRYDNTFGDFGVAISFEQTLTGGLIPTTTDVPDMSYALGFKYNAELGGLDLALGLGYQSHDVTVTDPNDGSTSNGAEIIGFSVTTTFDNGLSAGLQYTTGDMFLSNDELGTSFSTVFSDSTHIGVGFGYEVDAISLHLNYGQYKFGDDITSSGIGVAAAYDLGGGASAHFGYQNSTFEVDGTGEVKSDSFSLGLAMSF